MKNKFKVFDKLRVFVETALARSHEHKDEDPPMDNDNKYISDKTPLWIISLIVLGFIVGISFGYKISGKATIELELKPRFGVEKNILGNKK